MFGLPWVYVGRSFGDCTDVSIPASLSSFENFSICSRVSLPTSTDFDFSDANLPAFLPNTITSRSELPISLFLP